MSLRSIKPAWLAIVLLFAGCGGPPDGDTLDRNGAAKESSPPTIPANFAVRPLFRLRDGREIQAGTAFAATLDGGPPVLISAMHLFGEAGGLEHDLPSVSLPETIQSVTLYDMGYGRQIATAGKELIRDGRPTDFSTVDCSPDVVAFALDAKSSLNALPLAKENPRSGTRVWAVGREYADKGDTAKLYAGSVVDAGDTHITVKEDVAYEGRGFSGGPVVNARGEVIGTTMGSGKTTFGNTLAYLNPVSSIRRHLQTAGVRAH